MTVNTTTNRVSYAGNGTTTAFAVPFPFLADADLVVIERTDSTGAEVTKTLTTHYTVSGAGGVSGTVTMVTAPATGVTLTIYRDPVVTQLVDLVPNDPLPVETAVEQPLDRLTMIAQRNRDLIERALRLPDGDTGFAASDMKIPAKVTRASKYLAFDADGKPMAADPTGALSAVSPFMATVLDDADEVAAAATLKLSDTADAARGDAFIGGKRTDTNATAFTLHDYHENRAINVLVDFIPDNLRTGVVDGTGTTDLTTYIQAALNEAEGRACYFPAGTYLSGKWVVKNGTYLKGVPGKSVIKAVSTLGNSDPLLVNNTTASYTDTDITLDGLVFDGNNAGAGATQVRFTELLSFVRVTRLRILRCHVQNVQYIGVALGACRDVLIRGSRFTACGFQGTTSNGGSALWLGNNGTDHNERALVSGCSFANNYWHGTHFNVRGGSLVGNNFYNNKEAHIYTSRLLASNIDSTDIVIAGNVLDTVTKHDISSHGIETGAWRVLIANNTIRTCDHGGIALTDVQDAVVSGNVISNFNILTAANSSGVDVITTLASPNHARNIVIKGNRIFDDQATPTGYAAIAVSGSGATPTAIQIVNNNCAGTVWQGPGNKAIAIASGKWGDNCARRGNIGSPDLDPVVGEFQAPASTGNYSVTGVGFKPRRIEIHAVLSSTTNLQTSNSVAVVGSNAVCHAYAADGAVGIGSTRGAKAVETLDTAAAVSCSATLASYDDDGFTLNFTNVSARPWCRWVAYP